MNRVRRIYTPRPELDLRWQDQAACSDAPLALFFPDIKPDAWGSRQARRHVQEIRDDYCAECPVRLECLTHALTEPELHGIWAGFDPPTRSAARTPQQLLPAQEAHSA